MEIEDKLQEMQSADLSTAENAVMRKSLVDVAKRKLTGEPGHDEVVGICQRALAMCDQMGG